MHAVRVGLIAMLVTGCAAPHEAGAAPATPSAPMDEAAQVYRAFLASAAWAADLQNTCPDGAPGIDWDLMRDPESQGFRGDVDCFEAWLDLVRPIPDVAIEPRTFLMPPDIRADFPAHGAGVLRFSRVGFSPDRQRATLCWQVGRLGVFMIGGTCCLQRSGGAWRLMRVEDTWANPYMVGR